ncbi:MAG: hypothetical protein AB1777_05360 [Bacteroidota bacterium]
MSKKKCEKGKAGIKVEGREYTCAKCGASSNKKAKLCKPVKL